VAIATPTAPSTSTPGPATSPEGTSAVRALVSVALDHPADTAIPDPPDLLDLLLQVLQALQAPRALLGALQATK